MSQTLRDARRYEEVKEKLIESAARPAFHLCARVGWMNDPNGFSLYKDRYHMFYQYYPFDSHWGPMHWGHAVSDDLLHWEYLPAAIAPDMPYDMDGCFSGSALEMPDGRQMLMYTGVSHHALSDGQVRGVQTQNLAFGDGVDYEKYFENPVLDQTFLPENASKYDFRDPKMVALEDGSYRVYCVTDMKEGGGAVLQYRSDDGIHWSYKGIMLENHGRLGRMWECPDFFRLDGKDVLMCSSQDMLPEGFEYHNGNGTFIMTGTYDDYTGTYTPESDHAIDYGIDFYAPQTILTGDGRRVMIGWMQNWDTCNLRTDPVPWFGQMSLPRELFYEDGIVKQRPVRELDRMRHNRITYHDVTVTDEEIQLKGIHGRTVDLTVTVHPGRPAGSGPETGISEEPLYRRFGISFAQDDDFHTFVSFRPSENILKIDRKFSGSRRAIIHQRRAQVDSRHGEIRLRLILDRFSVEIFVNDGEKVLSATLITRQSADRISFFAEGAVTFDAEFYELR